MTLGPGETVGDLHGRARLSGPAEDLQGRRRHRLATFTVSGPRGTAPGITQGTDTVMVPVGGCALAPSSYPYAGIQTITGSPMAGFSVGGITVADADRLVAGSVNLAGGIGRRLHRLRRYGRDVHERAGGRRRDPDEGGWRRRNPCWRRRGDLPVAGIPPATWVDGARTAATTSLSASTTAVSAPKAVKAAKKGLSPR